MSAVAETSAEWVTAWEWPGGWRLVRPASHAALWELYEKAIAEAMYVGVACADEIERITVSERWSAMLFLLDPAGTVVRIVKFVWPLIRTPDDLGIPKIAAESSSYIHSVSRAYASSRVFLDGAMSERWVEGVLRVYGMLIALGSLVTAGPQVWEAVSVVALPDSRLTGIVNFEVMMMDLDDQLAVLEPWLVPGAPPDADAEVYLLLGQLPPAFTVPLLRAP